jgi:glycosyltransferase involved in cell wall biosynthesis
MLTYFSGVPLDRKFSRFDLLHATEHLLPHLRRIPTVFTLHDLIFRFDPASHLPLNRTYLNLMMPRFLRQAHAIIAVSECTRQDAMRLYGVPGDKIHVIAEGVDIRTVQELLGHKEVKTTQICTHVLKLNGFAVKSPADRFRQLLPSRSA